VGRIEEIRVEKHGKGYVVREFHLGSAALLERLSAHVGSWFGAGTQVRRGAWDEIDLVIRRDRGSSWRRGAAATRRRPG
jgi:hypothetical protein